MDFCVPFSRHQKLIDAAKELDIYFSDSRNDFEKLLDFLQEYKEWRVNIHVRPNDTFNVATAERVVKFCDNACFCLNLDQMRLTEQLREKNIPFYFAADIPARNFVELEGLVSLGVKDVYILDDLCYNMQKVSDYCHKRDVRLRYVLNKTPRSFALPQDYTVFFVRPQDIKYLGLYVDTVEFDCGGIDSYDFHTAEVLYKAFFELQDWNGNLQEIIKQLPLHIHNQCLLSNFTTDRMNCRFRCGVDGSTCRKCEQYVKIAQEMEEKGVRPNIKKVKKSANQ